MYERLKSALEEEGLTVYRLAKITGIYAPDIYNAINGNKPFYPRWREKIASALEIPEEELFIK